jgi:hypothetical protein
MQLRLCAPDDLPALMALGREYHAELSEFHLPLDESVAAISTMRSIHAHLCLGVEDAGELFGALMLHEESIWFSSAMALWDRGFFVRRHKRSAAATKLLLGGAKSIAADMGIPLFLTPFSGVDVVRKDKLLERAGFVRLGSILRWG